MKVENKLILNSFEHRRKNNSFLCSEIHCAEEATRVSYIMGSKMFQGIQVMNPVLFCEHHLKLLEIKLKEKENPNEA